MLTIMCKFHELHNWLTSKEKERAKNERKKSKLSIQNKHSNEVIHGRKIVKSED